MSLLRDARETWAVGVTGGSVACVGCMMSVCKRGTADPFCARGLLFRLQLYSRGPFTPTAAAEWLVCGAQGAHTTRTCTTPWTSNLTGRAYTPVVVVP